MRTSSVTNKKHFLPFVVILLLTMYLTFSYIAYSPLNDQIVNEQTSYISPSKSHPDSTCLDVDSHEERYMTYLPHSGFHNQRNSFENAIFLSWVLNRTLIIPPILFAKKSYIPHRPFDMLYKMLNGNLTNSMNACKTNDVENEACKFTQLDWEELVDFKFIKKNVR